MNAIEEGGKVATGIIDGLKSNPQLLFTLVMVFALNGLFVGLSFRAMQNAENRRHEAELLEDRQEADARTELRQLIIDRCFVYNRPKYGGQR